MPPGGLLLHTAASTSSPRCCGCGPSTACDLTAGMSLVSVSAYLARLSSCWDLARRDKCRLILWGEALQRPFDPPAMGVGCRGSRSVGGMVTARSARRRLLTLIRHAHNSTT